MKGKTPKSRQFFTPFGLALFVLSLVYIVAEALFNMQLLEVAGTVKSNPDEIQRLQYVGRSISAYGFTLLTLGLFEGTGFRLLKRRHWAQFFAVALVCLSPFALIFSRTIPELRPEGYTVPLSLQPVEIMVSTLPLLGLLVSLLSAGRYRPQLFISLVLLAWPAMFLGQKLLIESYVVDRTSWKERQSARYMLMLRAGLEDCILHLGDLQLCNDEKGAPDMKATRIIMSALWMLNPDSVLQDLEINRNTIIESAASRGVWFSPREQYEKYVEKVATTRSKYEQEFLRTFREKYYKPYKEASGMYMRAMDTATMGAEASEGASEVETGMEEGWKKYRAAVFDFEQTISIVVGQAVRESMMYGQAVNAACAVHGNCPDVDLRPQIKDAQIRAVREFRSKTGYPPDIEERGVFLVHPKTQQIIHDKVQEGIRTRMGIPTFTLPADWSYNRESFKDTIKTLVRGQVEEKWKKRFGKQLPPGLGEQAFMALLGIDTRMPPIEELLMSEEAFFQKYVVPGNQKMIQSMLDDLSSDRKKFKDNAVDMEAGKDYVEALYVPTISLVVSLGVVLLTLMRGLLLLPDAMGRAGWLRSKVSHGVMRAGFAAALLALLVAMPHIIPNPYASGLTYKRYLGDARKNHPAIAKLLNWAVHVQPVIYRAGNDIARAVKRVTKTEPAAIPAPQDGAQGPK